MSKEAYECVDDTVIEKLYSVPKHAELIGYFWSGKYHQTIKGINLITLYPTFRTSELSAVETAAHGAKPAYAG